MASGSADQLLEDPHVQEAIWRAIQAEQAASSSKLRMELAEIQDRIWQVFGATSTWIDMCPEAQDAIHGAMLLGDASCRYHRAGTEYEVSLDARQQTNLQTGTRRAIRLAPRDPGQSLPHATEQRSCHACTVHLDAAASHCHVCGALQNSPAPAGSMASLRPPTLRRTTSGQATAGKALQELQSLELGHKMEGRKFEDPDFPPVLGGRITAWRRPEELTYHDGRPLKSKEDWQLLRGRPCAEDVKQGELGDCWFLSSLAALAEYQGGRFLRSLLPEQQSLSAAGVYMVRLCLGGFWREILVDDRLPSLSGSAAGYHYLAKCSTLRLQLWASIIEKAFAKACGSYEALASGRASEALAVLTGWPCMEISFGRKDFDAELLWATLCSSYSAGFLMTCSTGCGEGLRSEVGLVPDHAYSLMAVHEVTTADGQVRLLQIRNPHAHSAWNGAWSQQSGHWTPDLRSRLRYPADDDAGMFFMAMPDFITHFKSCTICQTHGTEWCEARIPVQLPSQEVPCTGLALEACEATAQCIVGLAQPEERVRTGYFGSLLYEQMACLGLVVLNMKTQPPSLVAATGLKSLGAVSTDCWLRPEDEYVLVPLCLNLGSSLSAAATILSSLPVVVEERPLDRRAVTLAWAAYGKSGQDSKRTSLPGLDLYARGSEGLVVLAENRSGSYMHVELTCTSSSLHFSRGSCSSADYLAPGYAQLLQVAVPTASASWSYSSRISSQTSPPTAPWNQPELRLAPIGWLHQPFKL